MPSSIMESIVTLDVGAQEPWPNDVKLFQPYAMEQILLPDNANCLAVQAFLHMCGLPFQIEHRANTEFMSPSGEVPFIKCGAFVVSEFEPIVQFVSNKGITLTEELDLEQKSDMRAYMSIIHTVLMNAELYICWCDKRTYNEVTKPRNGSVYPWPLNHFQTWSKRSTVTKKLKVLGWYQKTLESVYQEVENCCQALSERLGTKEYFFGSKPVELDALLYGHVFALLSNPGFSPILISFLMKYPTLIAHSKRICSNYMSHTSLDFTEPVETPKFKLIPTFLTLKSTDLHIFGSNIDKFRQLINNDSSVEDLSSTNILRNDSSNELKQTDSETESDSFQNKDWYQFKAGVDGVPSDSSCTTVNTLNSSNTKLTNSKSRDSVSIQPDNVESLNSLNSNDQTDTNTSQSSDSNTNIRLDYGSDMAATPSISNDCINQESLSRENVLPNSRSYSPTRTPSTYIFRHLHTL